MWIRGAMRNAIGTYWQISMRDIRRTSGAKPSVIRAGTP
jgi:hypothetical protein